MWSYPSVFGSEGMVTYTSVTIKGKVGLVRMDGEGKALKVVSGCVFLFVCCFVLWFCLFVFSVAVYHSFCFVF